MHSRIRGASVDDTLALLDELCALEAIRQQRILSRPELARWQALQRQLTRALCDFATGDEALERRNTLRVQCPLSLRIASSDTVFEGIAIDLSAGGVGVRSDLLPSIGEAVTLLSAEEPETGTAASKNRFDLNIPGHVVWLRKLQHELGPGFGIAFDPQGPAEERRLAQLLLYLLRRERKSREP